MTSQVARGVHFDTHRVRVLYMKSEKLNCVFSYVKHYERIREKCIQYSVVCFCKIE